jgi:hypothetical protein
LVLFARPNWTFTLLDYYTSPKIKFVVCSPALGGDAVIEIVTLSASFSVVGFRQKVFSEGHTNEIIREIQ